MTLTFPFEAKNPIKLCRCVLFPLDQSVLTGGFIFIKTRLYERKF